MPDLSNMSNFPEEIKALSKKFQFRIKQEFQFRIKQEISIHLSWDKEFMALAKKSIQIMIYIFFLFLE